MASSNNDKLAVLIDADNAQASVIHELLAEVSRYGTASVKRAYGDWTTTNLKGWKEVLHKMAIQPMQQFSYTTGKNSTDSSLIIDAMDLLHAGGLHGFCLVSSDSGTIGDNRGQTTVLRKNKRGQARIDSVAIDPFSRGTP